MRLGCRTDAAVRDLDARRVGRQCQHRRRRRSRRRGRPDVGSVAVTGFARRDVRVGARGQSHGSEALMLTTALLQRARRPTLMSVCEARDLASRLLDRPSRASARAGDPDVAAGDYGRLRHRRCLGGSARSGDCCAGRWISPMPEAVRDRRGTGWPRRSHRSTRRRPVRRRATEACVLRPAAALVSPVQDWGPGLARLYDARCHPSHRKGS
jgi:hypothetical protein